MLNPALLPMLELGQGGLRGAVIGPISAQVSAQLRSGPEIEVYNQTRSIIGSVRQLYDVGSYTAATLILLFSVIVPVTKMLLVAWAVSISGPMRRRTLKLVETIAKWSMADVFAVALFITYLAAQATQTPPGGISSTIIAFDASFGPGFYWFAAYCVVSLAVQQWTASRYREVRHV
jgi:paraquat-inducible protein A